ncbi:uncharacterized protein PEZ65_006077 [Lycodopsis pacificus]
MSVDDDLSEWSPSLHNEAEALAVESAIRAAINTAMNVIRSACSRRVREYQSMVADRDREIGRLEEKLAEGDSEVRLLSLELDWRHTEDELSGPITSNAREINHGEHVNSSNNESVGAAAPMQISPKCHDTVEAFPHQHNQMEKPSWEGGGAAGDQPFGCIASLVKEESSDLETDIKWEACEGSLLHQQEGQHGAEYMHKEKPAKEAMEDDIASLIKEALSRTTPATLQPMVDAFQDVGVEAVDSMKPIQMDDLTSVLEPIQTHVEGVFSAQSDASHSNMEDFPSSSQTLVETLRVTTRRGRPSSSRSSLGSLISSPSNRECSSSCRQLGNDWHYRFQVPWNTLPAILRKKLDNRERPTAKERRETIRIIAAKVLSVCKNPLKRHLEEVARKMVLAYPTSFRDIMEDEVVGSGYDSLTKQLQCRVDNCNRKRTLSKQKSTPGVSSNVAKGRKRRRDSYGCIEWESGPVNVEAQLKKKRGMQKMFLENERNAKRIEQLMSDTFVSQRNDIRSGKDTRALKEEWPYLFSLVGMKAHFKILTGVDLDEGFEEAMATKFARVRDYFQSSGAARQRAELLAGGGGPCGAVLMLLSHFKEDFARMFHMSDKTWITDEVRTERLPPTPCIVACGASPMSAAAFMVAVDQEVIIEDLASFTDALVGMFVCYYVFNLQYPAELGATMEFLQRCIFKINPDKGSKVEYQENKRSNAVNPKVLTLITRISDFEWSA